MTRTLHNRKTLGQVFTPEDVAQSLVHWAIRKETDRLLDPACGDGRFLACHRGSVGVELDAGGAAAAKARAPWALIHEGDFFPWAAETRERFEAAVGNPPFIRYQRFSGPVRECAIAQAARLGARFTRLTSSWAPFLVVTASLLKPGGRLAFDVPAEIGHAPYATPVLESLCNHFDLVHVVAVRDKLFPDISEDAWLFYAAGFGGRTESVELSVQERFVFTSTPPKPDKRVSLRMWREAGCRLRKFVLPDAALDLYDELSSRKQVLKLGEVAHAGIGYVSGANDFFHLRPSNARRLAIPDRALRVAVRKAEQLPEEKVNHETVRAWLRDDQPVLLLNLGRMKSLPPEIKRYLEGEDGQAAREAYKCRNRNPWYVVPDVRVPDAFLSYMSGVRPVLVRNDAECVCTNSVHAVFVKPPWTVRAMQSVWSHPLVDLSCELEGHPLGGGLLKLEPREASNVRLPMKPLPITAGHKDLIRQATGEMRRWRHYA